jgi:alpha-tubulin suppressor-like RCC1 family protein
VLSLHGASSLAVSIDHTCALVEGEVYCWGFNGLHAINDQAEARCNEGFPCMPRARRVVVPSPARIVALPPGHGATCALDAQGAVYCWGANVGQALGPGGEACKMERCFPSPHRLLGIPPVTQVVLTGQFMCGLTAGRELLCWGNLEEQLHVSPTEPAPCKDCVGPLFRLAL